MGEQDSHLIHASLGLVGVHNPNGISIGSAVFAELMTVPILAIAPLTPQQMPLPFGDLNPHLMHCLLHTRESTTQMASRSLQPFLQGSRQRSPPYTLQWAAPFLQNCPFPQGDQGRIWCMVLWTHQSSQPKWHLDRFTHFFAGLTSVTDRQTSHGIQFVTIGRIYVRSTAIQPENHKCEVSAATGRSLFWPSFMDYKLFW